MGALQKWIAAGAVLAALLGGVAWLSTPPPAASTSVEIEEHGGNEYHVYPPGEGFEIEITASVVVGDTPENLAYQWVDFLGRELTPPVALTPGKRMTISSPSDDMQAGYYGLKFLPDDDGVMFNAGSGLRRELGFAVLPADEDRAINADSRFGLVHFNYRDPYLNPGWMKTATEFQIGWNGSQVREGVWRDRLAPSREQGQMELPIIYGEVWTDGSLDEIRNMMREIFLADPKFDGTAYVPVYELGIEENLDRGSYSDLLDFTAQKFRVVKEERDKIDPTIKLAYQVANVRLRPYRTLMQSELAREIDVLSVHPYPWSDWPTPDSWHDEFVDDIRQIMADNGIDVPIWYTEVGSVQNDAGVPDVYSGSRAVGDGQTRAEYAAYLIKLHAHAFDKGIEKVFWYNYMDRGVSTINAESHFGMRDYWGYPKPGYLAYAAMLRCMKGREASRVDADPRIRVYRFSGVENDCLVTWMTNDETATMTLDSLGAGLEHGPVVELFDTVGTPVSMNDDELAISTYPQFIMVANDARN